MTGTAAAQLRWKRLDLEIDTRNLCPAVIQIMQSALAQLGEFDMAALGQINSRRDQRAVNIHAGPAFELEEQTDPT
jgi:hypothetical protein